MKVVAVVVTVFAVISVSSGQSMKSATACFENTNVSCRFLTLKCDQGFRIRLLSEQYGVKDATDCRQDNRRCQNSNGCCAYSQDDCFDYYSALHKYNLYRECSWRQNCGPLPAPYNFLAACGKRASTYVYVEYECVPENTVLPICGNTSMSGPIISLVFDGNSEPYAQASRCDCIIFPNSDTKVVDVHTDDIRMIKRETSESGSDCSSATFSEIYGSIIFPSCDNNLDEELNFITNNVTKISDSQFGFRLSNLYQKGATDRPVMIWMSLNALNGKDMIVTCARNLDLSTTPTTSLTTLPTTTPSSGSSQTNNGTIGSDEEKGSNSGAVVAGVLVPIILIAAVAAVVAYFVIKRRRKAKEDPNHARPNTYTEEATQDDVYAEIDVVGDTPEPPIYDPVYEPPIYDAVYESSNKGNSSVQRPGSNGHVSINQSGQPVLNLQLPAKHDKRPSKNPIRMLSTQTDRFFAWFRNRQESSSAAGKNRSREASYDHTNGNTPVIVKVTSPEDVQGHVYSHQSHRPSLENPIETTPTGGRISRDMSAVHLGDSYIGFTFDNIDEDDPKLLKTRAVEKSKPAPPSRPPPFPSDTPRNSPTISSPLINGSPKSARPKSPMKLSPLVKADAKENLTYDYAESQPNSRRGSDATRSDVSDHSYKILEKEGDTGGVYDYADMEQTEKHASANATTNESGTSLYEDVDAKMRAESMKKHKSSADAQEYTSGYEVPVSTKDRPVSVSAVTKPGPSDTQPSRSPIIGEIKKNLLEKHKLKPMKPPVNGNASPKSGAKADNVDCNSAIKQNEVVVQATQKGHVIGSSSALAQNDGFDLVKSDNVKTKDYEKAEKLKGVRNMAKIFESKA